MYDDCDDDDSNQRGCSEFALSAQPVLPAVAHTGSPVMYIVIMPLLLALQFLSSQSSSSSSLQVPTPVHLNTLSSLPFFVVKTVVIIIVSIINVRTAQTISPHHLYKIIIMFLFIVLIVHLVGKFLLKAMEKNSVKSGTSSAYLRIIAMMNENEGVKENLTPLDNSFSTAAFSRAISPRTILKEVLCRKNIQWKHSLNREKVFSI